MRFPQEGGFYELNPFPGCAGIVVSNHSWIDPVLRGNKLGTKNHWRRLQHIANLGYSYALCTVNDDNIAQKKILIHNGWYQFTKFVNKETGHTVCLYGRHIDNDLLVSQP